MRFMFMFLPSSFPVAGEPGARRDEDAPKSHALGSKSPKLAILSTGVGAGWCLT
jgi:hypothetical protein